MEAPRNPIVLPSKQGPDDQVERGDPRPRAVGARTECADSRLDLWTHNPPIEYAWRPEDEPYLEVTVYDCGNGNAEVTAITREKGYRPAGSSSYVRAEKKKRSEMTEDDLRRCAQRARCSVRRTCLCLGANNLLTLTFRGAMTDGALAWAILAEFVRTVKKRFPAFEYVAVPELHKSGGLHFHLAIKGKFPAASFRTLWHRAIRRKDPDACWEDSPGNVDFKFSRGGSVRDMARYLTKYITKQFDQGDLFSHRFSRSKGIKPPQVTKMYLDLCTSPLRLTRLLQELTGGELARIPREDYVAGFYVRMFDFQSPTLPP